MRHPKLLVVCLYLLQQVTADPRPNFGIVGPVAGAPKLRDASTAVAALALTISSDIYPTLTSDYFNLDLVLYFMQQIGEHMDLLLKALDVAQKTVIDATAGDVANLFDLVNAAIAAVSDYVTDEMPNTEAALNAVIGPFLSRLLADDFGRFMLGLQGLQTAMDRLESAVQTAITTAGSNAVSQVLISQLVRKSLVNAVTNAVYKLRAYMPVINYTLKSTVTDLVIADKYVKELSEAVDSAIATAEDYGQLLLDHASTFEGEFSAYMNTRKTAVDAEIARSLLVPPVADSALTAALNLFTSATADVAGDVETHLGLIFDERYNAYELTLGPGSQQFAVDTSPEVFLIVLTLIENSCYSEYCFYKYAYHVGDLIIEGLHYTYRCIQIELERLESLMLVLQLLVDDLQDDVDDIHDQLTICSRVSKTVKRNACFSMLAGHYNEIGGAFTVQYQHLLHIAEVEIRASTHRMLACIAVAKVAGVHLALGDIVSRINRCRKFGAEV